MWKTASKIAKWEITIMLDYIKMRSNMNIHKLILISFLLLLSGCPGFFPGSQSYKPLPKWERQFFEKAKRDIYPNDVRKSPETYEKNLVV